jgi:hypothetical protein
MVYEYGDSCIMLSTYLKSLPETINVDSGGRREIIDSWRRKVKAKGEKGVFRGYTVDRCALREMKSRGGPKL